MTASASPLWVLLSVSLAGCMGARSLPASTPGSCGFVVDGPVRAFVQRCLGTDANAGGEAASIWGAPLVAVGADGNILLGGEVARGGVTVLAGSPALGKGPFVIELSSSLDPKRVMSLELSEASGKSGSYASFAAAARDGVGLAFLSRQESVNDQQRDTLSLVDMRGQILFRKSVDGVHAKSVVMQSSEQIGVFSSGQHPEILLLEPSRVLFRAPVTGDVHRETRGFAAIAVDAQGGITLSLCDRSHDDSCPVLTHWGPLGSFGWSLPSSRLGSSPSVFSTGSYLVVAFRCSGQIPECMNPGGSFGIMGIGLDGRELFRRVFPGDGLHYPAKIGILGDSAGGFVLSAAFSHAVDLGDGDHSVSGAGVLVAQFDNQGKSVRSVRIAAPPKNRLLFGGMGMGSLGQLVITGELTGSESSAMTRLFVVSVSL